MSDEIMDVEQAAKFLGVTGGRVRQLCLEGRFGFKLGGNRWLIRRDNLETYAASRRKAGRPPERGEDEHQDAG